MRREPDPSELRWAHPKKRSRAEKSSAKGVAETGVLANFLRNWRSGGSNKGTSAFCSASVHARRGLRKVNVRDVRR
jgi:hypothetical protein